MNVLHAILLGVVLVVQASTIEGASDDINFNDFCTKFYDLRRHAGNKGYVYRALEVVKGKLISQGVIHASSAYYKTILTNLCVEPSTYYNPECLYARRLEITVYNGDWNYFGTMWSENIIVHTYTGLWLLHPVLRGCLEHLNKPLSGNNAKDKLLEGLAGSKVVGFAEIIKNGWGKTDLAKEIDKSCKKEVIDQIFCRDLLDMVKLVEVYETVKLESPSGVKWNAYRLYFAMIKHNNPGKYTSVYPTPQQSNDLIVRNLDQIFRYMNDGQMTELKAMMTVVPVKSTRSGCENFHSLPSSTKNACMFWKVITQIRAYLKSTVPLGNGKTNKILNTNIHYPTFLELTEMDRILTVVQNTENALPNLGQWVTDEVKKNVNDRFRGLRSYFLKVESFNSVKSKADVDFIRGRLNDYKDDVKILGNNLAEQLGTILDYTFVAVGLEIVEKSAQMVMAGAVLMNPLEKLFGGSSVGDFMDRTAALAHAIVTFGGLVRVSRMFAEVRTTTETIGNKFKNNDAFLGNIYLLIAQLDEEASTAEFQERREKFLVDYTAYDPEVRRPELTGMTTTYENLIDACCDTISETETTAAAIPKAVVISKGLCLKAKETAAKFFETMGEIYDFQFDFIEAMATYMRAVTAQYAASDIVADYEERSQGTQVSQNVINDLKILSFVAVVSYKINIRVVTESYCDILAYKEGGVRPNVCQDHKTNLLSLASYSGPICRNVEAYKDVPISSTADQAFMNLTDLYAGKRVTFKIPNSDWLVNNNWISMKDRDSAIVVKKFELFLPTTSGIQRIVRSNAKVTGNNQLSTSSDTSYVIVPNNEFIFEYLEGNSDQPCRQASQALTNPYGANLPKLCPQNVDENNCQELLRKTPLFPSVYSRWKVSIFGYESATVPTHSNPDFKLKVGMKLCISRPRRNDKEFNDEMSTKKMKHWLHSRHHNNKLKKEERETCRKDQYWSSKVNKCAKCPIGSRPALDGYFCEKISKKKE